MNKITIWQPRWRDSVVLIAHFNVQPGPNLVHFTQAKLPDMVVDGEVITACPTEAIKSRSGKNIRMYAVPLKKLEAVRDKQLELV